MDSYFYPYYYSRSYNPYSGVYYEQRPRRCSIERPSRPEPRPPRRIGDYW